MEEPLGRRLLVEVSPGDGLPPGEGRGGEGRAGNGAEQTWGALTALAASGGSEKHVSRGEGSGS